MTLEESIDALMLLPHGWDHYDAEPPNETATEAAKVILHESSALGIQEPLRIMATAEGGVFLLYPHGNIETFNSGEVLAWNNDDRSVWDVIDDNLEPTLRQLTA